MGHRLRGSLKYRCSTVLARTVQRGYPPRWGGREGADALGGGGLDAMRGVTQSPTHLSGLYICGGMVLEGLET